MGSEPGTHRHDIQGLRGIAVLLVVAFHAGLAVRGGFIGVDVFFVVSGFVIGGVLLAELDGTGRVGLRDFAARRARRLLPTLAVVTTTVLALGAVALSPFGPQQLAARTAATATGFVANVYLYRHLGYFDGRVDSINPFLHLWSLSVEEQFYLVLPAASVVAWRLARRFVPSVAPRRVLGLTVLVASVASFWLSWAMTSGRSPVAIQAPARLAFYSAPTRLWEFGAGLLLAVAGGAVHRLPSRAGVVAGVAGAALIAWGAVAIDPIHPYPGIAALAPVSGATLLIVAGARSPAVAAALGWSPLRWIGDRSYGWYLWHWPLIVLASTVWPDAGLAPLAAAALALPVAALTYRSFEDRLRQDRSIVGVRALGLAAVCVAIPVVALLLVTTGTRHAWGLHEADGWYDLPAPHNVGCVLFNRDLANTWYPDRCTTTVPGATGTVLLLGDGAAESASTGLIEAAGARHLSVAVWARSGCPFLGAAPIGYPRCEEWQRAALDLVDQLHPALVVVANRAPDYTSSTRSDVVLATSGGDRPASPPAALARWRAGTTATLDALAARHIPVVLLGPLPDFGTRFPRARLSLLHPTIGSPTIPRADVVRRNGPTLAVARAAARARPSIRVVDPVPLLCGPVACPAVVAGQWRYYDPAQLTQTGSRRLTAPLGRAIDALLG